MLRRERLSTILTSCPLADRCNTVGQPQKPSPPRIRTFIFKCAPAGIAARRSITRYSRAVDLSGSTGLFNTVSSGGAPLAARSRLLRVRSDGNRERSQARSRSNKLRAFLGEVSVRREQS